METREIRLWASIAALVVAAIFAAWAVVLLIGLSTSPANANLAAPASALVAAAALLFNAWQYGSKAETDRSKFSLDMSMNGVRSAFDILRLQASNAVGPHATRKQWVNAARVLSRALTTARSITAQDHKNAWELFKEEWRLKFFFYVCRSPEYYLGLPEPLDYETSNKAYHDEKIIALLKKTNIERHFSMSRSSASSTSNSDLAEESIKVIYDFVDLRHDWTDPLETVEEFTDEEVKRTARRDMEGLHVYLVAKRKWMVLGDTVEEWEKIRTDEAHAPNKREPP